MISSIDIENMTVSFEIAWILKELGFQERCINYYGKISPNTMNNNLLPTSKLDLFEEYTLAPTKQQADLWLLSTYGVFYTLTFFEVDKVGSANLSWSDNSGNYSLHCAFQNTEQQLFAVTMAYRNLYCTLKTREKARK